MAESMGMLLDDGVLGELFVACAAVCGLSAALLIQCANDKRGKPKRESKLEQAVKSRREVSAASKKSARQAKSNRSQRSSQQAAPSNVVPAGKSKRSQREALRNKSSRSQKSSRAQKSKVGASERSAKKSERSARSKKSARSQKSMKSARPEKTGKQLTPYQKVKSAKDQDSVATAHSRPAADVKSTSLLSLQETQLLSNRVNPVSVGANNNQGLTIEPQELKFEDRGGIQRVTLYNYSNERKAVKVKCSDNSLYRVNPVFCIIDEHGTAEIEVVRQGGNAKNDRLVFVSAKAPAHGEDVASLFKQVPKAETTMTVLPLTA